MIASWLVGAGADHGEAGMSFVGAIASGEDAAGGGKGEWRGRAAAEALVDGAPPAEEDGVIIPLGCGAAEWHPKPTSRV